MKSDTLKQWAGILTILASMFTAFIAGLPEILDRMHVVTTDNMETATEDVAAKLARKNAKKMDSLFNVGVNEISQIYSLIGSIQAKSGNKMYAVTIRIDSSGKPFYRSTDNQIQPAFWKDEYKWWTYIDLRDGKEYPILFENKITLKELKNRADVLYDPSYLFQQIDKWHDIHPCN